MGWGGECTGCATLRVLSAADVQRHPVERTDPHRRTVGHETVGRNYWQSSLKSPGVRIKNTD